MNHKQKQTINIKGLGENLTKALKRSGECKLVGVGSFYTKKIKARQGVNPYTLAPMIVPKHTRIKFTVSKTIKNKINKK
jgi:nucleoid DNA-binding protein